VVQAGGHGSEAAGPVVRDVVKAYYDKKMKKTDGTVTAENKKISGLRLAPRLRRRPFSRCSSLENPLLWSARHKARTRNECS